VTVRRGGGGEGRGRGRRSDKRRRWQVRRWAMRSCGAHVPVADRRVPDLPRVQAKIAFVSDRLASRRGPGMSLNLRSDHNLNYVIPRVVLQNFLTKI
jgi:hypothetical protein